MFLDRLCTSNSRYIQHALKFDLYFQFICGMWLSQQGSQNELQLDDMEARINGVNICAQCYRNRKEFRVNSENWHLNFKSYRLQELTGKQTFSQACRIIMLIIQTMFWNMENLSDSNCDVNSAKSSLFISDAHLACFQR